MSARILVADDDEGVRAAVRKILVGAGYTVEEAGDGQAVLDRYRGNPSDLLLIDLYMPRMDGLETIIRLKAERPNIKIVALSGGGYRDKHDVLAMAVKAGARGAVAKPFEREDLLSVIADVLGTEAASPPAEQAAPAPAPKTTVLLVDDDANARWVLRKRLEAAGRSVVEAPESVTALQLFRAQPVDVVITDLLLPGKSGAELITALRVAAPTVGIVVISGAHERLSALSRELAGQAGIRTLPKQFTTIQLLEAIGAVLPAKQPAKSWGARLRGILSFLGYRKTPQSED